MIRILLVLVLMCTADVIHAQNCKFDLDKTDPFTNEKEQRISYRYNVYFRFSFYHKGADYRIQSSVSMPGEQKFNLPEGSKIDIKLNDGNKITLNSDNEVLPAPYIDKEQVYSAYEMTYRITQDQVAQIADSGILLIRTWLKGDSYYDYEMKKKESEKVQFNAGCILTN